MANIDLNLMEVPVPQLYCSPLGNTKGIRVSGGYVAWCSDQISPTRKREHFQFEVVTDAAGGTDIPVSGYKDYPDATQLYLVIETTGQGTVTYAYIQDTEPAGDDAAQEFDEGPIGIVGSIPTQGTPVSGKYVKKLASFAGSVFSREWPGGAFHFSSASYASYFVFPVTLTQDGGSGGSDTEKASWTYTAKHAVTGLVIGTTIDPTAGNHKWVRPAVGLVAEATFGYAHHQPPVSSGDEGVGHYVIGWINEVPEVEACGYEETP